MPRSSPALQRSIAWAAPASAETAPPVTICCAQPVCRVTPAATLAH